MDFRFSPKLPDHRSGMATVVQRVDFHAELAPLTRGSDDAKIVGARCGLHPMPHIFRPILARRQLRVDKRFDARDATDLPERRSGEPRRIRVQQIDGTKCVSPVDAIQKLHQE